MERVWELLRAVENIKLAQNLLEPEPEEMIKGKPTGNNPGQSGPIKNADGSEGRWADSSRSAFKVEEQKISIDIGGEGHSGETESNKAEVPIWMRESTVVSRTQPSHEPQPLFNIQDDDSNSALGPNDQDERMLNITYCTM